MKKIWLLLLSFVLVIAFSSCGSEEDEPIENPDGSVTLSFFGWGSAEEQENFQTLINEFMKENTDIKVVYSAASSDSYMNVLKNKGNNLPDVFYIPDYEFMQWADSGKLLALDEYVTQSEIDSMWDLSTEMYRYDRNSFKLGQGSLYGLPKDLGPYAIVYNKDLLQNIIKDKNLSLELPDSDVPMTWAEFVDYLKAITGDYNGKKIYGIGYYELMAAVYSNNADFFDAAVKKETITDPNFVEAVQFIADLSLKYNVVNQRYGQIK